MGWIYGFMFISFLSAACQLETPISIRSHVDESADSALDSVLTLFSREVDNKVIVLTIEYGADYNRYQLHDAGLYDEVIKNPLVRYRLWKDRILLIHTNVEQEVRMNPVQLKRLHKLIRPLLPDGKTVKKVGQNLYEITITTTHPTTWQFEVAAGNVRWLTKKITG